MRTILFTIAIGSTACSAMFGRNDQAMKMMNEERPIPPAVKQAKSFPEAQQLLQPAFNDAAATVPIHPGPNYLRGYPLDSDWSIERDAATKRVLSRDISVVVFVKWTQDGVCRWERSFLKQDEQGGTWSKPYLYSVDLNGNQVGWGHMGFRFKCDEAATLPTP